MNEQERFWNEFLDEYGDLKLCDLELDEDSLTHYGRKGMKWYQNIFTKIKEGARRFGASSKAKRLERRSRFRKRPKHVRLKRMSDQELELRLVRLRKEAEYRNLSKQARGRGKNLVMDVLETSGKKVLTDATTKQMGAIAKKFFSKVEKKK